MAIRGIDFETWGTRDLTVVGLDNYVNDPQFSALTCAVVDPKVEVICDFVSDERKALRDLQDVIDDSSALVAYNAGFERAVLKRLGIVHVPTIYDAAVVARAAGAANRLEHAAPQLLGADKLESGKSLIKKFSLAPTHPREWMSLEDEDDWLEFIRYCKIDAYLGLRIFHGYNSCVHQVEWAYEQITQHMNDNGWPVDRAALYAMQRRYAENQRQALQDFRDMYDENGELNLNSLKQLKEWCLERGIRATSFAEDKVEKMIKQIVARLNTGTLTAERYDNYYSVLNMLGTKQILGGSSLKKLAVLENTTGEDGRLRNQYMHIGAGQTYRTTGRGFQMQNLKRLTEPRDVEELFDPDAIWTNGDLAVNLRQLFTASQPDGQLIVGDFKSVESRGLAYLAGEEWKLDAYRSGLDLYKVQAAKIHHKNYEHITKQERISGKVGELSCGYGAGGPAVAAFATNMGIDMTEEEATAIVRSWRETNPEIVKLWKMLDDALHDIIEHKAASAWVPLAHGLKLSFAVIVTPPSLERQHPGAQSVQMSLVDGDYRPVLTRIFQGCYMRGQNVCYYKPDAKNGKLWSQSFTDPKTKQLRFYSLYGGKLAGILTQSFCREIFFTALTQVYELTLDYPQLTLIGQFHDEIIVDWRPGHAKDTSLISLSNTIKAMDSAMSYTVFQDFPLEADIKHDYRYTK